VFAGCCWKLVMGSGFCVIVTAALVTADANGHDTGEAPLVSKLTVRLIEPCASYAAVTVPGLTVTVIVELVKLPEYVVPLVHAGFKPLLPVTVAPVWVAALSVREIVPLVTELGVTLIVNVTDVPSQTGPAGDGVTATVGCG